MTRTSRKLPKEWARYEPIGKVVEGTRIFAFKTPLCHELCCKYTKSKRFTVQDFYRTTLFGGIDVGLVINATNTQRYYEKAEVEILGIEYVKLPMHGRSFVESDSVVKTFIRSIDDFLERNKDNNKLIGVHCTDGVNRSGYLICRYLIDRLSLSSHNALNVVETARGYTIERGALIQAVHRADRERRLRKKRPNIESDGEEDEREKRKKRKRQALKQENNALDDTHEQIDQDTLAQIMQLEQTLSSQHTQSVSQNEFPHQYFEEQNQKRVQSSHFQLHQQYQQFVQNQSGTSSPYVDSPQMEEDEFEDDEEQTIDISTLGKIDVVEMSTAQRRRQRRKKLEKKFDVQKRGRFWEINELNKQ
ncbi:unnamed protein product [Bursaphelenchus xylophilus]|uniref:(pine wood nematode) hypothetical protein n=1 Tax=Bursaphelenchus xylophilus TaxID=6326 RepID=A0A1I7RTF7_BURXY|nr:unnamed protein product [Bursaphelenchus xylophilus]CAG9122471.1 unnamed protein product [Bursaphelenchus xylophilus]